MIYKNSSDWKRASSRRLLLMGMSGVGKTHLSKILRDTDRWFHYSVDYRIGTRYMGEHIVDNFKIEAMQNPFLAELLKSDSIYIGSNITFGNLEPLSTYLGKPGDPQKGGLPFSEYKRRQDLHQIGERRALLDTQHFIQRAADLYGYQNFVCDSGGSICEVVNPADKNDEILVTLSRHLLLVYIREAYGHFDKLEERFSTQPKPMYYRPEFLEAKWAEYLRVKQFPEEKVDPDDFACWIYRKALEARKPRYTMMAENWGIVVEAEDIAEARDACDIVEIIAAALDAR